MSTFLEEISVKLQRGAALSSFELLMQ